MSGDRQEPQLKRGEMPTPRYLKEAPDTVGDGTIKWVGIQGFGLDGQVKDFLLWRNSKIGDLQDEVTRYHTAAFVTRLALEMDAETAIGPAVDLGASSSKTGYVEIITEPEVYGVYVEADKRPMFNFMTMMRGVRTEEELRREKPVEFDEIFQKAKAVLPRPTKQD